jgi:ligand-binding SRPBCC domain-containing protein
MKLFNLFFEQNVPVSVDEAWEFFSSPANLSKITPPEMNFTITSRREEDLKMFPGMIITYKVTPLKGIRLNWVTETSAPIC